MPTHINDQIRSAVVAAVTGLATTGSRVDEDFLAVKAVTDPRLVVRVGTGSVKTDVQGVQQREIQITVAGYAKDVDGISAVLGAMHYEVEVAMNAAGTLGGLIKSPVELTRDSRETDAGLERPAGMIEIEFIGQCFTAAGAPDIAL
jgi:hypothetical protein